ELLLIAGRLADAHVDDDLLELRHLHRVRVAELRLQLAAHLSEVALLQPRHLLRRGLGSLATGGSRSFGHTLPFGPRIRLGRRRSGAAIRGAAAALRSTLPFRLILRPAHGITITTGSPGPSPSRRAPFAHPPAPGTRPWSAAHSSDRPASGSTGELLPPARGCRPAPACRAASHAASPAPRPAPPHD